MCHIIKGTGQVDTRYLGIRVAMVSFYKVSVITNIVLELVVVVKIKQLIQTDHKCLRNYIDGHFDNVLIINTTISVYTLPTNTF